MESGILSAPREIVNASSIMRGLPCSEVEQFDRDSDRGEDDRGHPASKNLPAEKHTLVSSSARGHSQHVELSRMLTVKNPLAHVTISFPLELRDLSLHLNRNRE